MIKRKKTIRIRATRGDRITTSICSLICYVFIVFFTIPIIYVLISSFSYRGVWSFDGYSLLLSNKLILNGLGNSIFLASVGTIYSLCLELPAAYVISKKRYNKLSILLLSLGQFGVALLPLYLLLKQMELLNSLWSLILPFGMSVYYTHLLRARIINIADELEDAAVVDGANSIVYITRILIPALSSTIGCIAFFHACGYWSNTFYAQAFINDEAKYPLSVILMELLIQNRSTDVLVGSTSVTSIAAAQMAEYALCTVSTLPLILIFILMKKHIKSFESEGGIVL